MKKILSILLSLALLIQSAGVVLAEGTPELSDKTTVNVENTDTVFAKVTESEKNSGNYSLHFKATAADWLEVTQNLTEGVTKGSKYILSVAVKLVSGRVWFRVGWDDNGWVATHQSQLATDLGNGWVKFEKEVTLKADQTKILFHNDGAAEMYIDDLSLVPVGGTENLVPDGGFEDVKESEPTPTPTPTPDPDVPTDDIPDENLMLSNITAVNEKNTDTRFAKATDNEKNEGNYSLHFKAGTNDWLEVSQSLKEEATAGSKYVISASVKVVSGKVWFRMGWDDTAWLVTTQTTLGTDLGDGWIRLVKEVTVKGNDGTPNVFLFHNDGAAEMYIDDISVVKVGTDKELLPDGGFEDVTVRDDSDVTEKPEYDKYETIILSCTDFQNNAGSNAGASTVTNIINIIEESGLIGADAFFCCGDYANTYNETEENLSVLKDAVSDFVPKTDNHVYVQGNHDAEIGTQGLAKSGNNDPENGNYGVFVINEDDYMWFNNDLERIRKTAENLADYLNDKIAEGFENPIFVLSHLPLYRSMRTSKDGDAQHANQLFHVLNQAGEQGLNIVFMSGHDHSSGYESYLGGSAVYLAKGDSINIPQGSKTEFKSETLNFTYMNAGYVGYYAAASGRDSILNMALLCIDEDTDTVDVYRYDEYGVHNLKSAGILSSEEVKSGEYEADTRVYTSPQKIASTKVNYKYDIEILEDEETPDVGENIDDSKLILSKTTQLNGENTDTKFAKVTDDEKSEGNYSLHFKAGSGDWLEVSQLLKEEATVGSKYIISASVKVVSGKVWFRMGWDDTAWLVSNQTDLGTDLGDGWIRLKKEVTVKGNEGNPNTIIFHNDGATEMYIDDISVVKVGTETELVPDGGFEEVTISGGDTPDTPDTPDVPEGPDTVGKADDLLKLSSTTTLEGTMTDTNYIRVSDNEKTDGEYSLHLYSKKGEYLEFYQSYTQALTAGTYTLTWYAKGIGELFFYSDWGECVHSSEATAEDAENGWIKYTKEIDIDGQSDTRFLFTSDKAIDLYIDDISLVDEKGVNYIKDGGFDEVTSMTVYPEDYDDYEVYKPVLKNGSIVVDRIEDAGKYTVSVNVKNNKIEAGLPCELLVAVFDENGEMKSLHSNKENIAKTAIGTTKTNVLSVTFDIEEGYYIETYFINNRQDIDLYQDPVKFDYAS